MNKLQIVVIVVDGADAGAFEKLPSSVTESNQSWFIRGGISHLMIWGRRIMFSTRAGV